MMNNYEELKMSVVILSQDDIVTMSESDNTGNTPGFWN